MTSSTKITALLIDWSDGDSDALEQLLPLVEHELRRIARAYMRSLEPGNTLQTTAVINEAYIRLIDQNRVRWQNRAHFYGIAATMMRRVLLNYIRDRKAGKRGGGARHVSTANVPLISKERSRQIVALDEALIRLAEFDSRKGRVIELRFFGGLSVNETAEVLGVSRATVIRDWTTAKAWLLREISGN